MNCMYGYEAQESTR